MANKYDVRKDIQRVNDALCRMANNYVDWATDEEIALAEEYDVYSASLKVAMATLAFSYHWEYLTVLTLKEAKEYNRLKKYVADQAAEGFGCDGRCGGCAGDDCRPC